MAPKITIIVPVYNTEKYISECIQSILQQSLEDIELILINDCSTDNSLKILRTYEQKDSRITVLNLTENVGVGDARNKGIELAKGEFISFVDSDDVIKPQMLEKLYNKAKKDSADLVLCFMDNLSSNGKTKDLSFKAIYGKAKLKDIYQNTHPTARIVSRKLIDRINFQFLSGMGEGIYFELMIHAEHISTVPEQLYLYRSRDGSLSTTPNVEVNRNSAMNSKLLGERNPEYRQYFTFKVICDLLQLVANAIKVGDKIAYIEAVKELRSLNYTNNPYISTFYKDTLPLHRYIIKVFLLPANYWFGRFLAKMLYH
ncbi:TPA: glycosyltransferase [Streptococcus suis]|nr:glycosyltransferase [Streptococcus suis]